MPELPFPVPDDLDDEERAAYLRGAQTMAKLMRGQAAGIHAALEDAVDESEDEDTDTDSDDVCGDCGSTLIESFGGSQCPQCDL